MNNRFPYFTFPTNHYYKAISQVSFYLFIAGFFILSSCKRQQKIAETKPKCNLDFKNAKWLTEKLKTNEFHFNTFDGKLDVDALVDSSSNSFTASVRIKRDSIIWISVSKIGIEAARVLITKDSVKLINRINNQYFKGDFAYISKLLNSQLDYEILQALLVGNSVSFYDDDERLKGGVSDCRYLLGTIRKHKLKKVMERGKELKDPSQNIYLNPDTFKILRILFYDFDLNRSFEANFSDFTLIDSTQQLFPTRMNFNIKAQKNIAINIHYLRQKINEEVTFSFKIPDNYEEIKYKEK
jgi:hypothetical protein